MNQHRENEAAASEKSRSSVRYARLMQIERIVRRLVAVGAINPGRELDELQSLLTVRRGRPTAGNPEKGRPDAGRPASRKPIRNESRKDGDHG